MRGCTSTLRTQEARSYVLSSDTTQKAGRYVSEANTRAHAIDDFFCSLAILSISTLTKCFLPR